MKNIPLPIKFLINFVGPVSLEPIYWCKPKNKESILNNTELENIEKAFKEKKLIGTTDFEWFLVLIMNNLIGKIYNDEGIKEMIDEKNKTIKIDNEK